MTAEPWLLPMMCVCKPASLSPDPYTCLKKTLHFGGVLAHLSNLLLAMDTGGKGMPACCGADLCIKDSVEGVERLSCMAGAHVRQGTCIQQ